MLEAASSGRPRRNAVAVFMGVSPALFAFIHLESGITNVAATYLLGVLVALAFLVMRNIWPLIAGHACIDFTRFSASGG